MKKKPDVIKTNSKSLVTFAKGVILGIVHNINMVNITTINDPVVHVSLMPLNDC